MSRESQLEKTIRQQELSRRALLKAAATVTGIGLVSLAPGTRVLAAPRFSGYPFALGVASGDPLPSSVILWTRLSTDPLGATGAGLPEAAVAVSVARALAALADVDLPATSPVPTSANDRVELTDLLGVAEADDIVARWAVDDPRDAAAIGRRGDELVEVAVAGDVTMVVGSSMGDAFDVAATSLLAQCVERSPDALWVVPMMLERSSRSELLARLPQRDQPDPDDDEHKRSRAGCHQGATHRLPQCCAIEMRGHAPRSLQRDEAGFVQGHANPAHGQPARHGQPPQGRRQLHQRPGQRGRLQRQGQLNLSCAQCHDHAGDSATDQRIAAGRGPSSVRARLQGNVSSGTDN